MTKGMPKRAWILTADEAHRGFRNLSAETKAGVLHQRAGEEWARGKLRAAFHLYLAAAKAGMGTAIETIAYFYDAGVGVKADEDAALHWYRRAYRCGSGFAANNIAAIWIKRKNTRRALLWFHRAVDGGDGDANLEIAKIHLSKSQIGKAVQYLNQASTSAWATQGSKDEARQLLKELRRGMGSKLHRGRVQ
jgi:TPR repeat protein